MRVIKKQNNSKMCIICGLDNTASAKASFYEMEDQTLCSLFQFQDLHQSYPGRVHGGMISAMLDELACRAYWIYDPNQLAVTMTLDTKFRKPVPYQTPLIGTAKITKRTNRYFEAYCEILNEAKEVLAEGNIRYLLMPNEKITDASIQDEMPYFVEDDILEIDLEKTNETR